MNEPPGGPPAVSVVIPCYNATGTVSRALQSVLAQDCPEPIEIIVVDDGSQDDLPALLRGQFPTVQYVRQERSGVPGAARNRGVAAACADLIAFLDADDEWLPDKLTRQLALLRSRPEAGFVITRSVAVYPDGHRQAPPPLDFPSGGLLELAPWLLPHFSPQTEIRAYPSSWLIRRSLYLQLGGQDGAWPNLSDWHFIARALLAGEPVAALTEPLLNYYVSPASLSHNPARLDLEQQAQRVMAFIDSLRPAGSTALLTDEQHAEIMFVQARFHARGLHHYGYLQGALDMQRLAMAQPTAKPLYVRLETAALIALRALFGRRSPRYSRMFRTMRRLCRRRR